MSFPERRDHPGAAAGEVRRHPASVPPARALAAAGGASAVLVAAGVASEPAQRPGHRVPPAAVAWVRAAVAQAQAVSE